MSRGIGASDPSPAYQASNRYIVESNETRLEPVYPSYEASFRRREQRLFLYHATVFSSR